MRHMIIILSLLFVSFGVFTSGKENCCLQAGSVCKVITCEETPVVETTNIETFSATVAQDNNYQPLSPVSHFILL